MALAFDAVGPSASGSTPTATSPATWSHTCTGTGGLLLVGVAFDLKTFASLGTMTVTYAGAAMTLVTSWNSGGSAQSAGVLAVWKKIAPAAGTNTVSVGASSGWSGASACGGSLSFSGADQSAGIGAATTTDSAGANATAWTSGTITTTTGNILTSFVTNGSDSTTFTTGTSRFNDTGGGVGGAAGFCAAGTLASTGSNVIGGAMTSDFYAAITFEVLAAAATGIATGLATAAGTAQNAGTSPHNMLAGPAYAGTATDLGGVYGAWATTQFATGGP